VLQNLDILERKTAMRKWIPVALLCLGFLGSNLWAADRKAEVEKAERAWADGIVQSDLPALEKLLAEDLVYTHSNGDRDSKASYLDRIRTGKLKYSKVTFRKIEVYLLKKEVAFTASLADIQVMSAAPQDMKASLLHVFVKRQGRWQLAAHQSARLP
jgi:ketosteroid isomerase-like protein